jgi:hypothetical protein
MKTCSNCQIEKPNDRFRKNRNKCKHCEYLTHKKPTKEQLNKYARTYVNKHREKVNAYKRTTYENNKERYKDYYQNNKERLKAKQRFRYKVKRLEKKLKFKI